MNWYPSKYPLIVNPYDSFMKKHLQHYGYFTGRNMAIKRFGFEPKRGYKSNYDSDDSDSESDSDTTTSANNNNKPDFKPKLVQNENYKWWGSNQKFYNLGLKDVDYQREPRWPIEMQVLPERIRHIDSVPKLPEPFYTRTGTEETPMVLNDPKFRTVFYYRPTGCGCFVRSRLGGSREGCQNTCADLGAEAANTLAFESRFESGNLMKAVKITDTDYQLYLRYDLFTEKHTQWFYFQVSNAKPNVTYRFTICNFLKPDSLYNNGMKPLMYSELDALENNIGWRRCGSNIKYYKNNTKTDDGEKPFYSLTWTCTFPNANDTYYFAHCYPYTYSDLQDYLKAIQDDPIRSKFCRIKVLCRSLAENLIQLLTITNPTTSQEENKMKKGVVITARVHPGETNASWMMKGFLDFLLSNSPDAKILRDNFVFKIIPMLNPDGVIIGNYRCSLTGRDLNRNYKTILKEAFPSTWHTREMIRRFNEEREIIVYCDLHGHSRKNNVFIYGCHNNKDDKRRFKERVFPYMLAKNASDKFSYNSCKYRIQKNKEGTGRIVMWNMGILNSFTMEATFSGSTLGSKAGFHFTTRDFESMGYVFCDSLLDYCDPDQTKVKIIMGEIETQIREAVRRKLESRGVVVENINQIDYDAMNINIDDLSSGEESSDDGGSDSSVDDGLPLHLEHLKNNKDKRTSPKTEPPKEVEKRTLKPIANPQLQSQLLNQRPRSAKALNNGIPIFTHERAEERATKKLQTVLNITQLQFENGDTLQNDSNVSFRYTNSQNQQPPPPPPVPPTTTQQNYTHLCEQHKKKLNDFFLFRHLTKIGRLSFKYSVHSVEGLHLETKQPESDGNASDDEAELDDTVDDLNLSLQPQTNQHNLAQQQQLLSQRSSKPTFEEYVNKYVFTRSISFRNKPASQTPTSGKTRVYNFNDQQPLDIKSIIKEETYSIDERMLNNNSSQANHNINNNQPSSQNNESSSTSYTKPLIRQMSEKRVVTLHRLDTSNNQAISSTTISTPSLVHNGSTGNLQELVNRRSFKQQKSSTSSKSTYQMKSNQPQTPNELNINHNIIRQEDLVSFNAISNASIIATAVSSNSSTVNLRGQFEKSTRPPLMRQKLTK